MVTLSETNAAEPAPAPRRRLEGLPSGPRLTSAQAAARSVLVRRLRIGLPMVALVLVGVFLISTQGERAEDLFLDDFADPGSLLAAQDAEMRRLRFADIDAKGNPYEVTADRLVRRGADQTIVDLEQPRATLSGPASASVVVADSGRYDTRSRILDLGGSVAFDHQVGDKHYRLTTPAATLSMNDDTVVSDSGVQGVGPDGATLAADRMRAYNSEGRFVFEGNFRMILPPDSLGDIQGAASTEPEETDQ